MHCKGSESMTASANATARRAKIATTPTAPLRSGTRAPLLAWATTVVAGLAVVALASATAPAVYAGKTHGADGKHNHEHVQLGAHEHGHGRLTVAIEGGTISLELEIPSGDIVGFEHAPTIPEQTAQVETARQTLAQGLALWSPSADANCSLIGADVEAEGAISGKAETSGETHSEFHATYELTCTNPANLTGLEIGDVVHINDIKLPAGAKPTVARNFVIANIAAPSGLRSAGIDDDAEDGAEEA